MVVFLDCFVTGRLTAPVFLVYCLTRDAEGGSDHLPAISGVACLAHEGGLFAVEREDLGCEALSLGGDSAKRGERVSPIFAAQRVFFADHGVNHS